MEQPDFYKELQEDTKVTASQDGEGTSNAFLKIITNKLEDALVIS